MSSSPIVITTSVDLAGIEGYKAALKGVETSNEKAAAGFANMSAAAQQASRFMASGMNAKEAEGALIGLGYSAKQAADSMASLDAPLKKIPAEFHDIQVPLSLLPKSFTDFGEAATTAATRSTRSVTDARFAAMALGEELGMVLPRAVTTLAGRSATLGPILNSAFSIIAIAAFIEILGRGIEKLVQLADAAQKSADEQAAFERSLLKSTEALDQMRIHSAAITGPLAEAAERTALLGDRALDVSEDVKKLNERIADSPGFWKQWGERVGLTFEDIGSFVGVVNKGEQDLSKFNRQVADGVKQQKDLAPAIGQVSRQIDELRAKLKGEINFSGLTFDRATTESAIANQIVLENQFLTSLRNQQKAFDTERENTQQEDEQKLLADHSRAVEARISFDENAAKTMQRAHVSTFEQERASLLTLENERRRAQEAELNGREAILREKQKEEPQTDFSDQFKALADERVAIEMASRTRAQTIAASSDEEILKRDLDTSYAQIEAISKVAEARDRQNEDRAKRAFDKSDDPAELEKNALPYIQAATQQYNDQITAIREKAAALESTLSIQKPSGAMGQAVTANLGTDEFAKQLQSIKQLAPQMYAELSAMNAEEKSLAIEQATAIEQINFDKGEKLKSMRAEDLNNSLRTMNEEVSENKAGYEQELAALQVSREQKKTSMRQYVADVKALSQSEYAESVATYERETEAVRRAVADQTLTQQQGSQKLLEIWRQQETAFEQMQKRMADAAKLAADTEAREITQKSQQMAQIFSTSINKMILEQGNLGRDAAKLGQQLELYIIDQGIKKIATTYAADLLQMLASHSSFLASLLGIQTAGNASQVASQYSANQLIVMSDAGVAYAGAFASAMTSLPYPANIAAAPALASAAAAETISGGLAFERGGIMPGENRVALLHPHEMVLPEHISSFVQDAAAGKIGERGGPGGMGGPGGRGGDAASSSTVHNHNQFELHVHGGKTSKDDVIDWVKQGIHSGSLP